MAKGQPQTKKRADTGNEVITHFSLIELGVEDAPSEEAGLEGEQILDELNNASKLAPPTVDCRNSLNDLTGSEWLPETKSFFFQKGLGAKHPHAQIERLHPAPYSFQDIGRLV